MVDAWNEICYTSDELSTTEESKDPSSNNLDVLTAPQTMTYLGSVDPVMK